MSKKKSAEFRRMLTILNVLGCVVFVVAISLPFWRKSARRNGKEITAAEAKARIKREKNAWREPGQSVVVRTGLPNLRAKLAARAPVTVAFLGGSITKNAGEGGFVNEIAAWIAGQAAGIHVETINAGIGNTGSDLGAQRINTDALVHRPEVLFVEFAVNDSDRECTADMERIVRITRQANPQTDIVFLYCVMDWTLPRLEAGRWPPSVIRHEKVAEHYGIPTIALGYEAARKVRLGEWTWKDFSNDACHPTAAGYASYNRDLAAALPLLLAVETSAPNPLPPPLVGNGEK